MALRKGVSPTEPVVIGALLIAVDRATRSIFGRAACASTTIERSLNDRLDLRGNYPEDADPVVLGESANTITTYGYDPATGMQQPKATLCEIAAA